MEEEEEGGGRVGLRNLLHAQKNPWSRHCDREGHVRLEGCATSGCPQALPSLDARSKFFVRSISAFIGAKVIAESLWFLYSNPPVLAFRFVTPRRSAVNLGKIL